MRIALFLTLLIVVVRTSDAQTLNPYDQFGYHPKNQYIMTKKTEGLLLLNENVAAGSKNLLINHKSKQIFVIDSQDSVLQVFNVPAEAVTRFISVDPLIKQYPELTPYQFASNTPIQAVDLDGKEAFFVHGTASGPESWSTKLTNFIVKNLTNNIHFDATFSWESRNGYLNNEAIRKNAAYDLVTHIIDYRQKNNITHEEITLVGFSHGGNVAIQAAHYLNDIYGITVNIVNFNTPAYNGPKDPENPQVGYGINELVHYWTKQDGVVGGLVGSDRYKDGVRTTVTNIELNAPLQKGFITSHFLENINTNELATKLKKPEPLLTHQANPTKNKYDPTWKPPIGTSSNNSSTQPPGTISN